MIEGLRAIAIPVPDLQAAARWYADALEVPATDSSDGEVTFHLGGYRILLVSNAAMRLPSPDSDAADEPAAPRSSTGPCLGYLEADDLPAECMRLAGLGAVFAERPRLIDARVQATTFIDPFGNRLGLLQVDDPDERRARSQRAAEKVALRNVRATLDELQQTNEQQRKRLQRWGAACAVIGVLLLAFLWMQIAEHRVSRNELTPPSFAASAARP